ncbi:hypothetical protein CLV71_111363 [Actinophytocola oryzae]|uniref:Uncharacterized protein n=2 Tax=Actinophytocola oryzae TaxID=502181 RepID=A0A4R7VBG6_9PSEU|nr:hypothetical protein CLV71_111363 [Actinophytocola oryzae]
MRAAGLVVVAVVSGLVWYAVTNGDSSTPPDTGGESSAEEPGGVYQFTAYKGMPEPDRVTDCAAHAYGKPIQNLLQSTPCDHLTRQLFVTKVDDRTIYTSVSVVVMRTQEDALALVELTDQNETGNVSDVVRDGVVKIEGIDRLSTRDGYASKQSGREVIIVESDFAEKDKTDDKAADENILDPVSTDAIRLAARVDGDSGTG